MLKNSIINSELLYILSRIGHTQTICICDAGLPIPLNAKLIDLSLFSGYPDIQTVLTAIIECTPTEKAYCATESIKNNPAFIQYLEDKLTYDISYISHEELKKIVTRLHCLHSYWRMYSLCKRNFTSRYYFLITCILRNALDLVDFLI